MSILLKEPITKETLDQINKILTEDHAELFHQAFIKEDSKEALKIVVKELFSNVLDTSEKVDYAIRELVGM
ncbi:hypothetical protein ABS751_10310, partial [Bacillus subtilis]